MASSVYLIRLAGGSLISPDPPTAVEEGRSPHPSASACFSWDTTDEAWPARRRSKQTDAPGRATAVSKSSLLPGSSESSSSLLWSTNSGGELASSATTPVRDAHRHGVRRFSAHQTKTLDCRSDHILGITKNKQVKDSAWCRDASMENVCI